MGAMTMIHRHVMGRKQASLLDAGCSDGIATKDCMSFLRKHGHKVSLMGVDRDEARIKKAQNNSNGVDFVCADLKEAKFEGQFDIIICLNAIRYIDTESKKQILQNLARMLKPDGMMVTGINKHDMKRMNLSVFEPPRCPRHNWMQRWLPPGLPSCNRPLGDQNDTRMIARKKVEEYANLCS